MRIIVKGATKEKCQKEVTAKIKGGWLPVSEVIEDKTWIPSRWVCVMSKPIDPNKKHSKFNRFMGM